MLTPRTREDRIAEMEERIFTRLWECVAEVVELVGWDELLAQLAAARVAEEAKGAAGDK
jgi:hypothetical protein